MNETEITPDELLRKRLLGILEGQLLPLRRQHKRAMMSAKAYHHTIRLKEIRQKERSKQKKANRKRNKAANASRARNR